MVCQYLGVGSTARIKMVFSLFLISGIIVDLQQCGSAYLYHAL